MKASNKIIKNILQSASDIEEKLDFFSLGLEILAKRLNADGASFFEVDEDKIFLEMKLHYKNGLFFEDEENLFIDSLPYLEKAIDEKEPVTVKVFSNYFLYIPFTVHSFGVKSRTKPNENKIAFIRLERLINGKIFSGRDIKLAEETLKNFLRNFFKTEFLLLNKKYGENILTVTGLSEIFATSLRDRGSFRYILKGIQKHFGFDRIRLYLVDNNVNKLKGELSVDIRGNVKSLEFEEIPLEENSHRFADIVLKKKAKAFFDRYTDKVLNVPLVVEGEIIGLMVVDNMLSQQEIEDTEFAMLKAFAGQIALVVDNISLFDKVKELSLYDELTKLPLRRYFFERFHEEVYRADRFNQPMAVIWADIDYFKEINDTYGHQIGDKVLKEISRVISGNLRKIDFPCRYGGDEILVMLPQASGDDALRLAQRLVGEIKDIRIDAPFSKNKYVSVSLSLGIATFPEDAKTADELMHKADDALYWVKSKKRGSVALYGDIKKKGGFNQ